MTAGFDAFAMRDIEIIESKLRLLAAVRRSAAELGAPAPRIGPVDELLDEWIADDVRRLRGAKRPWSQIPRWPECKRNVMSTTATK
jgi:hypothetical protein